MTETKLLFVGKKSAQQQLQQLTQNSEQFAQLKSKIKERKEKWREVVQHARDFQRKTPSAFWRKTDEYDEIYASKKTLDPARIAYEKKLVSTVHRDAPRRLKKLDKLMSLHEEKTKIKKELQNDLDDALENTDE
jgi:hypothetical protein